MLRLRTDERATLAISNSLSESKASSRPLEGLYETTTERLGILA
jgi:hypothetical protein